MSSIPNYHRIVCMLLKYGKRNRFSLVYAGWYLWYCVSGDFILDKHEDNFNHICIPATSALGKAITMAW